MKFLLLGGCGFIGTALSRTLVGSGHDVRVLDLGCPDGVTEVPGIEYLCGSFLDSDIVADALHGVSTCVHLAGTRLPADAEAHPADDASENIVGSIRLFEACGRMGVRRVAFISSGGTVYGEATRLPIAESSPTRPISAYGISKLSIEGYLKWASRKFGYEHAIIRLANPYGPGQSASRQQGVIPIFIRKLLSNQPIEIWGSGAVQRDFIFIKDAAEAIATVICSDVGSCTFNVGSGHGTSLNDLIGALARVTGRRIEPIYRDAREFDVPANVLDIRAISEALSWCPRTQLDEGLRRTVLEMS
jgi:UDP-glucose 4-epimerase